MLTTPSICACAANWKGCASHATRWISKPLEDSPPITRKETCVQDKLKDELLIRQMVERWAVWRDAGDWERFATVWHPQGVMMATWFQGPFADFIRVTQEGWAKGVSILHFLGGSAIEVEGDRAIAQTKMTISQRGMVEGRDGPVLCDVVCTGRFYDFVVRHEGQWKLLHRQPIYEKDRIDPLDANATLVLDQKALAELPEGYRHLAYIQTRIGYKVKMDMPMLKGPVVEELYRRGARWLAGGDLEREVNPPG
ncbi:MAG: nuclear transport factor 2 family protein [Hydrogenophaga sp.]|nr:nuclear transport factor 2 family protein [Hydrogenophaga sp.]